MKQTFKIPDGCNKVTIEQVGNQIVTTFEPEKYTPKAGDYVKMYYRILNKVVFCKIQKANASCINSGTYISCESVLCELGHFLTYSTIEQITIEDYKAEFEKRGYTYDEATDTASKKRWRAEKGALYFYLDFEFDISAARDDRDYTDNRLFGIGNYFKTQNDAEKFSEIIKKEAINFHTNNK